MLNLREIHKPKTIEEAVQFLKQPGTFVLAGGTGLIASHRRDVRALVDVSELNLAYIRDKDGAVAIGAMTLLADITASPMLRAVVNGVVAQAAHRAHANLLRNQATVSGTLIAEPDGIFALVLLALDARVMCSGADMENVALADLLAMREHFLMCGIVTEIVIPAESLKRRAVIEMVARTPRDKPIVSVCPALEVAGDTVRAAAIALSGVADVAVRATEAENILASGKLSEQEIESAANAAANGLNPQSDFRGSAEYRREMVTVLTARALIALTRTAS